MAKLCAMKTIQMSLNGITDAGLPSSTGACQARAAQHMLLRALRLMYSIIQETPQTQETG